jgi:hypothetical protein
MATVEAASCQLPALSKKRWKLATGNWKLFVARRKRMVFVF